MDGIASKLFDAASMFWAALDQRERTLLLYFGIYVAFAVAASVSHRSRERLKSELREEIARGAG